jgi:hypothetical protein
MTAANRLEVRTMFHIDETDPEVEARRDSHEVFQYRVRNQVGDHPVEIHGAPYNNGDIVLLDGWEAHHFWNHFLELADPEPVKQTEDPRTWMAQYPTDFHVYLNSSLRIHHSPCPVKAKYAGDQAIARIALTFNCGQWFAESHLTLKDAIRLSDELTRAIEEMNDHVNDPEHLCIHQVGGSY